MTLSTLDKRLLLSAVEVAALCGSKRDAVDTLVKTGVLPPPLPVHRGRTSKRWWSAQQVKDHLRRLAEGNQPMNET